MDISFLQLPSHIISPWEEVSTVSADGSQVVVVMGRVSVSSAQSSAWGHPVLHPLVIIMLPGFVTFFINN